MNSHQLITPAPGMEFEHAVWLTADCKCPMRCRVMEVRQEVVYWRAVETDGRLGMAMHCQSDVFPLTVKTVLAPASVS